MNLVAYSDSSSDEGGTVGRRGSGEDSRQDSPTGKLNAAAHVRAKRAAGTAPGPPAARCGAAVVDTFLACACMAGVAAPGACRMLTTLWYAFAWPKS
eukprot:237733-Chlamydomonas_euryale.AAC.7